MTDEPDYGRRSSKSPNRKHRLIAGTSSAPFAIVICYAINRIFNIPQEEQLLNIAINSIVGSFVTVLALCFNDLRGIFLERFGSKRHDDAPGLRPNPRKPR